jgi:hypothetical protein
MRDLHGLADQAAVLLLQVMAGALAAAVGAASLIGRAARMPGDER